MMTSNYTFKPILLLTRNFYKYKKNDILIYVSKVLFLNAANFNKLHLD